MRDTPSYSFWEERSKRVLAQGATGTNSKRPEAYIHGVTPTHLVRAEGCYVWDWQGKKYLDMVCGLGPNILGYRHPMVSEAVIREIARGGGCWPLASTLEVEVAEKIQEMIPCAEKVRFLKTGNEATLAAVRWARAYNGNTRVISNGYHGHGDLWTRLTEPASGVKDRFWIHSAEDDDPTFPMTFAADSAFIVEPIKVDASENRKTWLRERMEHMKSADCAKGCAVTIFDEIVTGFRVPKYTVANWWGLRPDMICLGKACANGYPLAIVAGRADIMDQPDVFVSSTFSGETIALAACLATLQELEKRKMEDLYFYANRFQDNVNTIMKPLGIRLEGYGTRAMFKVDCENAALFMQECHKAGILLGKAWYYSFAHMDGMNEEVTLNILSDVAQKVLSGKAKMEGTGPQTTFKR